MSTTIDCQLESRAVTANDLILMETDRVLCACIIVYMQTLFIQMQSIQT